MNLKIWVGHLITCIWSAALWTSSPLTSTRLAFVHSSPSPTRECNEALEISCPACPPLGLWRCTVLLITAEVLRRWLTGGSELRRFHSPRILEGQLQATVSAWRRWRRWALLSSYECPAGLILCTEAIGRCFKPKLSENEEVPQASHMIFPYYFSQRLWITKTYGPKSHHPRLQHGRRRLKVWLVIMSSQLLLLHAVTTASWRQCRF